MRKRALPLLLAFVWLLVYPACSTQTAALEAPEPVHVIEISALEGMLGFAFWDCEQEHPATWVRTHYQGEDLVWVDEHGELWATDGFRATVKHEARHLEQALDAPDCEAWEEMRRDSVYRQRAEFEAVCAGLSIDRWVPCNRE